MLYWGFDNINYLIGTGILGPLRSYGGHQGSSKRLQHQASLWANRAFFVGAIVGVVGRCMEEIQLRKQDEEADGPARSVKEEEELRRDMVKRQSMILKSLCDIVVFSNNTGINWHQRWRGRKNNETIHCGCGLLSAAIVLYHQLEDRSCEVSKSHEDHNKKLK